MEAIHITQLQNLKASGYVDFLSPLRKLNHIQYVYVYISDICIILEELLQEGHSTMVVSDYPSSYKLLTNTSSLKLDMSPYPTMHYLINITVNSRKHFSIWAKQGWKLKVKTFLEEYISSESF